MKRTVFKIVFSIIAFMAVNLWLMYKAATKGDTSYFISWKVEETILFILLQIFMIVDYFIYPLKNRKQKIIFWCVSELLVLVTVYVWGIWIIGPIWFQ